SIRRSIPSNCSRSIAARIRGPEGRSSPPYASPGLSSCIAVHIPLAVRRNFGSTSAHLNLWETVMAGPHENLQHAGHAQHGAHEGGHNKQIALIISGLALFLAFSETFGKSSQTNALNFQIEASNLWNFFQAKNIRRTAILTAAESAKI